ncbi:insulinase family protein [bacterium]|nr:insulinase family protein [bacterium]
MYSEKVFSNGFKLITAPARNTKTATILILLPAGSRHESRGLYGASHFIEHLMFKGTSRRPSSLAIARELDKIGAQFNAFTSKDHTGYWVKTTANKVNVSFDVLSDMLFHSLFRLAEFEQERNVILEEIKMYEENPLLYIDEFFEKTIYHNHILGKPISGRSIDIKKMNLTKLISYRDRFYQPSQMVMAAAGNIDKSQIIKLSQKYFANNSGEKTKNKYNAFHVNKKKNNRVRVLNRNIKQAQIALGGFALPYDDPQTETLLLLSIILGGNMSSRLFGEVRVKRGLAYFIKTELNPYQDVGSYTIRAGVDKEKVSLTLKVILGELKKIKKYGVSKEELKRAKDYFQGVMLLSLEDSSTLSSWYAKQSLFLKQIITPQQKLERIKMVRIEDIKSLANRLFKKNSFNLAVIGPFKSSAPFLRVLGEGI